MTTNESKTGALEGTPVAVLFGAKLGATTKTALTNGDGRVRGIVARTFETGHWPVRA